MGRKGVSKRKSKKSRPFSNAVISDSSNGHSSGHSLVQSLVIDKGVPLKRDGINPSAGSNKKHKKAN